MFFYVKSIHLRGSCRKVKKAVRRRMHAVGENEQNQSSPIQASNDYTIKGPEIRLAFTSWPRAHSNLKLKIPFGNCKDKTSSKNH